MKDKLEQTFKDLLENQELPYDSSAWDSMSKLLDQQSPIVKPSNFNRWFFGGASITVIAVASYFIFKSSEKTTQPVKIISQSDEQKNDVKKLSEEKNNKRIIDSQNKKIVGAVPDNKETEKDYIETNPTNFQPITSNTTIQDKTVRHQSDKKIQVNQEVSELDNKNTNEEIEVQTFLIVCKDLCIGEVQTLENKNGFPVSIVRQNTGDVIVDSIAPNSSLSFNASSAGIYTIKSETTILGSFEIKSAEQPDLEVESNITYIKGVPTIKAVSNNHSGLIWLCNNKLVNSNSNEIEINPFKAGLYSISAISNGNECRAEANQVVEIEENYNLLAANTFEPTSFEPKRQTFIPFALTQRDVQFTMIIQDLKDGGIVYQTSDATLPWNGTDMRSGQIVKSGYFIWQVKLENPLEGESSEYNGTIIKL